MTDAKPPAPVPNVRLDVVAADDRNVLGRLLQFNAYEFSRFDGAVLDADGTYGYPYLDAYWSEAGRVPYFILADDELAGFALIRQGQGATSVAEFLVLPKFRRRRVGAQAARLLFDKHRGPWEVSQLGDNTAATEFWRRVIPEPFTEHRAADGSVVQSFSNRPR